MILIFSMNVHATKKLGAKLQNQKRKLMWIGLPEVLNLSKSAGLFCLLQESSEATPVLCRCLGAGGFAQA